MTMMMMMMIIIIIIIVYSVFIFTYTSNMIYLFLNAYFTKKIVLFHQFLTQVAPNSPTQAFVNQTLDRKPFQAIRI